MNFISECILRSRKLDDGEERREYIALSEVKMLFEQYRIYLMQEMEKMKYTPEHILALTGETLMDGIRFNDTFSLCQKLVEEKNG